MELHRFSVCTKAFAKNSLLFMIQSLHELGWTRCALWGGIPHICPQYGNEKLWSEQAKAFWSSGIEITAFFPEITGYGYNPASADPFIRSRTKEYLQRSLNCCLAIGAKRMLLHPGVALEDEDKEQALRRSAELYQPLLEQMLAAEITPVLLCGGVYDINSENNAKWKSESVGVAVSAEDIVAERPGAAPHCMGGRKALLILFDGPGGHLAVGDGSWNVRQLAVTWAERCSGPIVIQFDDRRYITDARETLGRITRRIEAW